MRARALLQEDFADLPPNWAAGPETAKLLI
jgi:hypothetical protein